jgi:biopolymer transport protein ExbB
MNRVVLVLVPALMSLAGAPAVGQQASPQATPPPASPLLSQAAGTAQQDLEKSLKELADLRQAIQAEKVPLTQELTRLEARLTDLRRQQEETSRGQDMRTLEINNMTAALKLRQEEMSYVSNLLDEYARGFESGMHVSEHGTYGAVVDTAKLARENRDLTLVERLSRQMDVLGASLARARELLGGVRFDGEAVDPKGLVAKGQFALIGPVALFASTGGAAGLALPQTGSFRAVIRPLEEALNQGLAAVVGTGEGLMPLDPTRGGALKELVSRGSLLHYFERGGPIMWPLLVVSILAITVILERLVFLARERRRRSPQVVEAILERVANGEVAGAIAAGEESQDFLARALTYGLKHREKSLPNALMRAAGLELVRFNRGISILDTCITVAPLLGLLGTVTGMMGSFGMLGGGELSAPAQITGGIAEALIATAFGLGIAVTSLLPMNYLHSQSEKARHEMEDVSTHLELLMKPVLEAEAAARESRVQALIRRQGAAGSGREGAPEAPLEPATAGGLGAPAAI